MAPELRTADLLIRPPVETDAATAPTWPRPSSGAGWSGGSHAAWHAVLVETGRMVGNVSLFAIDRDDLVARIGYRVLPASR